MNDFQPNRTHFSTARDAVALARLITSGDEESATEMIGALMEDPASIPVVMSSLSQMIGWALVAPPETQLNVFFEAVNEILDNSENGGGIG
jgi:hypothetical protein